MIADGLGPGDVQKEANLAYHQLSSEERDTFQKIAEQQNRVEPTEAIPRERLIRKIVANIDANVCTFYHFFLSITHFGRNCLTLAVQLKHVKA